MNYLEPIDYLTPDFGDLYDELPLWSAHFGLMLLDQVNLRPGINILDVGAGTGFLSIELAQRCGEQCTVIAVDPWESAIQRLERKIKHLGLHNVRTLIQDAKKIELPRDSVDLVISNLGINNFEDPEGTLRHCFHLSKPGAELILTTNLVGHMAEFYEAFRWVLLEKGLDDRINLLESHIQHRATVDSVRTQLEKVGYQVTRVTQKSFQDRYVNGSALLRHYFIRLGFVQGWKSILPPEWVEEVFGALEEKLNRIAAEKGGLSLTIPMACIQAIKPV